MENFIFLHSVEWLIDKSSNVLFKLHQLTSTWGWFLLAFLRLTPRDFSLLLTMLVVFQYDNYDDNGDWIYLIRRKTRSENSKHKSNLDKYKKNLC